MELHRIVYLYQRWKEKQLSEAEQRELRWLLGDERAEQVLKAHWEPEWEAVTSEEEWRMASGRHEAIFEDIIQRPQERRVRRLWRPWRVAAAVVLVAAIGYFAVVNRQPSADSLTSTEILPGGNRATLTLADGTTIDLDEAQSGIVIGNDDITYTDGIPLGFPPADSLTLTTPKGGIYQVTLPDGSKVWLNANSSLKYPSRFDGDKREVILEGEAFFAVRGMPGTRDTPVPFIVQTVGQTVEVLGTQFNISAYADDAETKTALVEGSVRVDAHGTSLKLVPGELGLAATNQLTKQKADIKQLTAWKNGEFHFRDAPIRAITAQLANWYDVEFLYTDQAPTELFNAMISRDRPLSHVLKLLEETGAVRFKLNGRKVYVSH